MARWSVALAVAVVAVVAAVEAQSDREYKVRTCYKCDGCTEGQRGHPVECASFQFACYKLVLGTRVEKGCATGATCSIQDLEKGISGVLSSITGNRASDDDSSRVAHCCNHDYCNGAASYSTAPTLCAAALAALLARAAL